MAIARDPVMQELKRSISASASLNHSTLSLEGLPQADIDMVVNRKWRLDEVIGPLRSKLAILSGGRDRRGGPIITITGTEHSDLRPTNVGRLLSYLSKVADESLQGLGFTVVLDMREASWHITKRALKSLQLTFVEHVYQVFVVKPKAFWQRQRVGMTFTLSRSKFNFPVVMLEHSGDIFSYLQVSQLTRELGGTLSYNHDRWIDTQRTLEKHLLELLGRLNDFEQLREQLEVNENPENLNEARDAVRRHVEAKQRLDKSDLDSICEVINNTIVKLFPCTNSDFLACFTRLEELCNTLQLMRDRLERMWTEKGGRLDQILQLRVYENDSEQILRWIQEETLSLSHDHTDVGDSLSTAELSKQSFEDYQTKIAMKHQETGRILQMGDRLIAAFHYASELIRARNVEVRGRWEAISKVCEERLSLLSLSVVFHDKQQKFFQRVEGWVDECMVKHFPTDIPRAEELLQTHKQLQETYQEMYTVVRREGHRMIDIMRKPIGESSLPLNFIVGTRHVKEILESLYDEMSWVDEQWGRRHMVLRQALNLRKFQEEAKKVHLWIADKGNAFLSGGNTIGDGTAATQGLLKKHDIFEAETEKIYLLSNQLFSRAKELASSGDCEEGMIGAEKKRLEETVHTFAARLDERREIIVHSFEYYQSVDTLSSELKKLSRPIPREKFNGSSSDIEPRLEEFQSQRSKVNKMAGDAFNCCERLVGRLRNAMATAKEAGTSVNYSAALESVQRRLEALRDEKEMVDKPCDQREERWSLCIQLNQFRKDVQKHQGEAEAWSCEQERTEWEPSENPMDAQLELETFQRQYDLLSTSHKELVAKGRSVAKQTDQLDLQLFGGHTGSSIGSPHPAVATVEDLIGRMEASQKRVDGVAVPRLRQLRDYLQCHLLHQRASKLTTALSFLSTSLLHVVGIGDSLETAKALQFRVIEANQKLKAISQDVESFCQEVEDCLQRQHYESSSLVVLAHNLQEKLGSVSRTTSEKLHIIRSSVELHCNISNLSASLELCQRQFSSRDTGQTVADSTILLKTLENLRSSVEVAAEEVQSQGRNLLERMAAASQSVEKAPVTKTTSEPVFKGEVMDAISGKSRNRSIDVGEMNKTRSSDLGHKRIYEMLEGTAAVFSIPEDSESSFDSPDSPKLLVTPRRAHPSAAGKPTLNFTAMAPSAKEEQVIQKLLQKMEAQLQFVRQMYQGRQNRLERSRKVIEFKEGVPQVMEWVDTVGSKYLMGTYNYGRSIEEVTVLMEKHKQFEQSEVANMANRVEGLKARYNSVEASGHSELNELRGMAASLEKRWNKFSKDMKSHSTNLDLSLKFHETLFQASNWCQKSQQFLDSMEEKKELCDCSAEAAKLVTELSVYLSATKNEQEERVLTVKEIGNFLRSNLLMDLSNQIEQSTERTMRDFEQSGGELKRHHAKLAQIENEKDREKRLQKKREWVLEELLQTEEAYVSDLKLIVEKCRPRFVSDLLPNSLKGKEGIIFSNIHEIEKFHKGYLLPKLRESQRDIDGTARILMESVDKMAAVYVPYCTDKTASEELLASHRTYLFRVQSMFGTDTPLSTLLIKPVQRITKYPLLLRDALKYTTELGLPTHSLQDALEAVEKIPVATNNAIHLSLLQNYKEVVTELGTLLYQGPLLVSEPKFKIKVEKERQVFVFQSALLFARRVEFQGQAKFKYECKAKIPITSVLQVNEFQEGEPCKFIIASTDHKLHFKASTIESKQLWVKSLRTAILERRKGSFGQSLTHIGTSLLSVEGWAKDLMEASPRPSPHPSPSTSPQLLQRRMNGGTVVEMAESPLPSEFERYQVKEDYRPTPLSPPPNTPLSLAQGDIVEVLDDSINRKWYVRTVGKSKVEHGWIPSEILERSVGEDEADLGGRRTARGSVQVAEGPLNTSFDEEKLKHLKNQKAFGSHDLQSQQVIGLLKRMTFGPTDEEMAQGEEDDEVSSLDRPVETVEAGKLGDLHPSVSLPHMSPHTSPLPPRRSNTETLIVQNTNINGVSGGGPEDVKAKTRWRRRGVIRKRSQGRSVSVSSESPSEKMMHSPSLSQLHSSSSDEDISTAAQANTRTSAEITEEEMERVHKAQEKLKYIMSELLETEREYVQRLEECINGYMKEMQSPNLPDSLKGKERLIFGNIQAVYDFHHDTFLDLLEGAKGSLEDTAKCFLDQAHNFEVYVTYCENKPKSESFLWTFHHNGGTFFEDVQNLLGHRQGIDSFLIKPVQRITKYQLLLRDLHRSTQKAKMETPNLAKALLLMQDVPKRANDAMTLSMIYGYEGNIHSSGQIILQDEFTVFERSRWTGAKRHIFLLEQRLVITKEKGDDGMYMYKDSLKIHNLALAEKDGDSPCRFSVGTGQIGLWDQFYILDAGTAEKKQHWVQSIKEILKQQFELLKALKQPKPRSRTLGSELSDPKSSVAMINLSDDSEDEESLQTHTVPSTTPWAPKDPASRKRAMTVDTITTFGEPTPSIPSLKSRPLNLYIVAEDCAPPKENEGILFIHKGQVYDIIDDASDWWLARLVRNISSSPGDTRIGQKGWIPGSFLDKFDGELSMEEEAAVNAAIRRRQLLKQSPIHSALDSPKHRKKSLPKKARDRVRITSSYTFEEDSDEENEEGPKEGSTQAPRIVSHISDETVIAENVVQLCCQIKEGATPTPSVEWTHNWKPLNIDRAFTSFGGESCVLRIKSVQASDEGTYTCTIWNERGVASSTARLTVLSPPDPPGKPIVKPLTCTSVSLSWEPPASDGHSPIKLYIVECKDSVSNRWSTLMKRITEPSFVVDDLMPGIEYLFRVVASNQIGLSKPSTESDGIKMARTSMESDFLQEPFENQYQIMEEISRGHYGTVYECIHNATQQTYAAKLIPLEVGKEHAKHELDILGRLSHPNIIQVTSAYVTQKHFVILFPLISGVNVLEYFVYHDCLSEDVAAGCVEQVLAALCYLHNSNIAHLDIQPENIMVMDLAGSAVPEVTLIHMERSREIPHNSNIVMKKVDSCIEYEAPEILTGEPVTTVTDMWSLGVLLYILLGGTSPFLVDSLDLTKDNIVSVRYSFPVKYFREVSNSAKDLISKMIVKDKSNRISSTQCLRHPWLASKSPKHSPNLSTTRLKSYVSSRKWQHTLAVGSGDSSIV